MSRPAHLILTKKKMTKFKPEQHILVSKHSKLGEKETKELLEKYGITKKELPRILKKDPAIKDLSVKSGDILKIERNSPTAGTSIFYRCVVNA
jgi:DNA-directed RNA polymerase subunit H